MNAEPQKTTTDDPGRLEATRAPSLMDLFLAFLRLGATAFGGPAMVTYIREMAVDRKRWLDACAFDDGVALCQAVPGATAMQTAAYVGLRARGVAGAAASFSGFALPAFGLMMLFSAAYERTHALPTVISAFGGLKAMVVAVVANSTVVFGRTALRQWRELPIALAAVALFGIGINPFFVVVFCAVLGLWLASNRLSTAPDAAGPKPLPHTTRPLILILGVTLACLVALFLFYRSLYQLATMMLRIDLFAFGGGFASLPLLFDQVVRVRQWLDAPTLLDGISLGQVTPGPIVITATFVGYLVKGPLGAVVATFGIFLPSFLMVIGVAPHFDRLRTSPLFTKLIGGALCSFPGLLLIVTIHFARTTTWDLPRMLLAGAAFTALRLGTNILWVVLVGIAVSLIFCR